MYLCSILYFLSYHFLKLLITSIHRIFLNFLDSEFRLFFKEYASSQKMQKANNLLLPLLINTIISFKVIWFKCNFKTFRLLCVDVLIYPQWTWFLLSDSVSCCRWMTVPQNTFFRWGIFKETYVALGIDFQLLSDLNSLRTDFSFPVLSSDWDRFVCATRFANCWSPSDFPS